MKSSRGGLGVESLLHKRRDSALAVGIPLEAKKLYSLTIKFVMVPTLCRRNMVSIVQSHNGLAAIQRAES